MLDILDQMQQNLGRMPRLLDLLGKYMIAQTTVLSFVRTKRVSITIFKNLHHLFEIISVLTSTQQELLSTYVFIHRF